MTRNSSGNYINIPQFTHSCYLPFPQESVNEALREVQPRCDEVCVGRKFLLGILLSDLFTVEGPASPLRQGAHQGKGSSPAPGWGAPPSDWRTPFGQSCVSPTSPGKKHHPPETGRSPRVGLHLLHQDQSSLGQARLPIRLAASASNSVRGAMSPPSDWGLPKNKTPPPSDWGRSSQWLCPPIRLVGSVLLTASCSVADAHPPSSRGRHPHERTGTRMAQSTQSKHPAGFRGSATPMGQRNRSPCGLDFHRVTKNMLVAGGLLPL